jgi:hypothetical protein
MVAPLLRFTVAGWILSGAGAAAAPADQLVLVGMRLSDEASYSWSSVISDDADTYEIKGRTERDGGTWQCQPLPRALARRVGRAVGSDCEAFFLGPERWVIATEHGWRRLDELPRRHRNWHDDDDQGYYVVRSAPSIFDPGPGDPGFDPWGQSALIYVPPAHESDAPRFSNYRFGLALPHEDLAIVVNNAREVIADGDTLSGTLSDLGAQLLLVRDGSGHANPLVGAGTFKLWIQDGLVVKYSLHLGGVVAVKKKQILVQQQSTTVITRVGLTTCEVPDEVRRRLAPW